MARRLFERDFAHVRRVYRNPAKADEIHLRAAMLCLRRVLRREAQALEAAPRRREANAVDVARGNSRGARQTHEQRVDVSALTAEILRLEHEADVAGAAAPHFRIAER